MPKIIPHNNIEYAFKIHGKVHRLVYIRTNEKGRLVFENLKYHNYTTMTESAFRYYMRKCKEYTRDIAPAELRAQENIVEIVRAFKRRIKKIEDGNFSERASLELKKEVGYSPKDIISDLHLAIYLIQSGRGQDVAVDNILREYNFFCRHLQKYREIVV